MKGPVGNDWGRTFCSLPGNISWKRVMSGCGPLTC